MSLFRALDISSSALQAERVRLEVHISNLANVRTTRTAAGGPYQRREVYFEAAAPGGFEDILAGVHAQIQVDRKTEPHLVFDPAHPDANDQGYLALPGIDPVLEQADIVSAARAYEANIAAIRVYKDMLSRALTISS